jgi:hypothetical protein
MSRGYVYKKPVKRSHYSNFRRYLFFIAVFVVIVGAVGYFVYTSLHNSRPSSPISAVENTEITDNKATFSDTYFQFQDTGTWVVDKNNSTATKRVYHKFRKNVLEHEMIIYINQVPIPLNLEVPRVLPVRIVNNNSLQTTNVSQPCVGQYAKGELHKVKEVQINNATMLCDPDSPQYSVVVSEINGDYRLNLKRPNGTPIQFVITYKDLGLAPQPDSVINIASSFKTL